LLRAIADWNDARTEGRVSFSTQVSIDCTRDPEMLKLCSDAGLVNVFVGIETPNSDSLKETKKRQNIGVDMVERIQRFPAHGILVTGGMMVGFDSDTTDIFERQYEFGMSLPVPMFTVAPLSAPMATPLYARMEAENRLVEKSGEAPAAFPWTTNIVPKQMTQAQLIAGTRWLCNRLYRPAAFEHRVARFIDSFKAPEPRKNSRGERHSPQRTVDAERLELSRSVTRLGPGEAAMAARLQKRLERKPAALPQVLLAMGYYMQIRHIYQNCGLWDPELGRQARLSFEYQEPVSAVRPEPSQMFSVL
jgi:hypothetical protein